MGLDIDQGHAPAGTAGELSYRRLLDASTEVLVALIDLDGRIAYANAASRSLLGYEPEELVGHTCGEIIAPGLVADATAAFRRARDGHPHLRQRILARRKDGHHIHLRFDATPMSGEGGAVEGVVIAAYDIGEELAGDGAEIRHVAPPRGQDELIERLPAIVYVAEAGPQGRWRYLSPQIERMFGYSREEWLADPGLWASRLHPDDRARVLEEEERDTAEDGTVASEYRVLTRAGRVVWVRDEAVLRLEPDGSRRYDGLLTDITERKRFESRLQFFADHDSLTGLSNRRRFLTELDIEIRRMRRHAQAAAVLMLDLDDLKEVNDTRGHAVGDILIRATADVLRARLRESDTVARLGGDEFAAILRGTDRPRAAVVAAGLVDAIRERARSVTGGDTDTGASVGVVELHPGFETPDDVLAAADAAMYGAKRKGGGRVEAEPPNLPADA